MKLRLFVACALVVLGVRAQAPEDCTRFRGANGSGVYAGTGLPLTWSADKNVVWKTPLPGFGASSPITLGKRIFLTCYSGYGLDAKAPGKREDLRLHLLCIDRDTGKVRWDKSVAATSTRGPDGDSSWITRHGYASSTPVTDGKAVYAFFGANGVFAFDLDGKELWKASVGTQTHGFGSGASPIVVGDLLIVNASVECGCLVALDRTANGKEVWRAKDVKDSWNTPVLVEAKGDKKELVLMSEDKLLAYDPVKGDLLWHCAGSKPPRYVCPSAVSAGDVVYAVNGYFGPTVAVRSGGRGDVTETHQLWPPVRRGSNVSSPVYHDGHLYFVDHGGTAHCIDAKKGARVYQENLLRGTQVDVYAQPIVADGRIYYVSRDKGTFVLPAKPKFEVLARNTLAGDDSIFNGSPVVSGKALLLRSDRFLYCIGEM
jgi:outer membrane protein assembly factor BamB